LLLELSKGSGTVKPAYLAIALAAAVTVLASCSPEAQPIPAGYLPHVVQRGNLAVEIEELGVVESTRVANINSPFSARLIKIAESGTSVKKGDVVAVLDTREQVDNLEERLDELKQIKADLERQVEDMQMALRSNSLDLSSSQARLDLQRVQLEQVNLDLAELEYLRSREIVPAEDVRTGQSRVATTQINTLSRDLTMRSDVTGSQSAETAKEIGLQRISLRGEKARERLDEMQERINNSELRAPVDGVFLRHSRWSWQNRRNAERENGEGVREGDRLGSIPDATSLIVKSQIPEGEVLRVQKGSDVTLNFEALGGLVLPGRIIMIAPLAIERETSAGGRVTAGGQELTGEKVFEVEIELLESDPRIKVGLTARSRILIAEQKDLLSVPVAAVQAQRGKHFVEVWSAADGVSQREVVIGKSNDTRVEIVSGVAEGEEVLLPASSKKS
jgi:multidrug resistance efflux pump